MDIALRFNKDMLVLNSPVEAELLSQGVNTKTDLEIINILEPDTLKAIYDKYVAAGAHCMVANTKGCLKAKLAMQNLDDRLDDIAEASLKVVNSVKPQHVIVEFGSCGLPLDIESKNSLIEIKDQYVYSARIFEKNKNKFDAYLLSGMHRTEEMKCALMGLRQVSDKPIFITAKFDDDGMLNEHENIYDYANVVSEYGATIVGLETSHNMHKLTKRLRASVELPILLDIDITEEPPDDMLDVSMQANKDGAQFLRATGNCRVAHTAVLSASTSKLEVAWKSSF